MPKVTAAAFERYGFHNAEIMMSWETIVGADLARLTRPEAIKWPRGFKARVDGDDDAGQSAGATLTIACDPAFALEVSYRHQEIADRINRYFGYRAIAHLRIVQVPGITSVTTRDLLPERRQAPPLRDPEKARDLTEALDELGHSIASTIGSR